MLFQRLQEALLFWWRHLPAIALVTIPFSLLSSAVILGIGQPLTGLEQDTLSINGAAIAALFVVRTLAEAALIGQLAALLSGQARKLTDLLLLSLLTAPALLLANALILLSASLGLLLFILPGAWIFVRLSLAAFLIVLEGRAPFEALQQSLTRTAGSQWEMLVAWLFMLTTVLFASQLLGALLLTRLGSSGGAVLLDLFTALGSALLQVLLFRYYSLTRP